MQHLIADTYWHHFVSETNAKGYGQWLKSRGLEPTFGPATG